MNLDIAQNFSWPKLMSKITKFNFTDIIFNDYNIKSQFSLIPGNFSTSFLVVAGFIDNTFKIFKDKDIIQSIKFHKVLISKTFLVVILN